MFTRSLKITSTSRNWDYLQNNSIWWLRKEYTFPKNILILTEKEETKMKTKFSLFENYKAFVLTFWLCRKNSKFSLVLECNKKNISLQNSYRKWGRTTNPRPLFVFLKGFIWGKSNSCLFFKKFLYEIKASGLQLSFNIFRLSTT